MKIGNEYELFEGEVLEIIMSSIRKVLPTNYEEVDIMMFYLQYLPLTHAVQTSWKEIKS